MQFLTKKRHEIKIQIIVPYSIKTNINSSKFIGLIIDNTLSWNDHIAALTLKLNKACYAIRAIKPSMSLNIFIYLFIIVHPFCHICNTGPVQPYTTNHNTCTSLHNRVNHKAKSA